MTQILILASCVYLSLLVAAIYFTRASARRVVGALLGGGTARIERTASQAGDVAKRAAPPQSDHRAGRRHSSRARAARLREPTGRT